ncbi:Uma2 family endonuclease [Microcoleus sp. herbarium12]|jgi:Uma2 family endonuclease|uniref:Uma2 family endonuclease n=1 Tax=Microcoleus sp. herbarium12 TaxID=3055437 RepID=UPI002FD1FE21
MQLELKQITVQPGSQILLKDITWQMFETILVELGEHRASRLSYSNGTLEIMVPLPEHEIGKVLIGDLVKILLEELDIEFCSLGSTTLKNAKMAQGLEADDCFYIQNEAAVRGKNRLDLATDPPPDLAIEIDITSRAQLNNYEALGVPELWRYNGRDLQISVLQDGKYIQSDRSCQFPNFAIAQLIPQYLAQSKTAGRNVAMKAFRAWVKTQI